MVRVDDASNGGLSMAQLEQVGEEVRREREAQAALPLSVAIMGQTGVGKSTLLNGLFGADLPTGGVRPTTKEPTAVSVAGTNGHPVVFWDLPGIGESADADRQYLRMYLDRLIDCDVVIWALHADSRSTAFDLHNLTRLLDGVDPERRRALLAKVTFVLTKADLLGPPPWVFELRGDVGAFGPTRRLVDLLAEKAGYVESMLVAPWGDELGATTFHDGSFTITDERMEFDKYAVRYRGHFSQRVCDDYSARYPAQVGVFERLRENHRVLPCSSRYRYNLTQVLAVVVNKLGFGAVSRFQRVLGTVDGLGWMPAHSVLDFGNFVIWDGDNRRKVFDLADLSLDR